MVAPFSNGRIARSMVRVPGSGIDESAGPICLNLGNVSSFAAMIPVPQTLSFNNQNSRRVTITSSSLSFSGNSKLGLALSPMTAQKDKDDDEKPTSQLTDDAVKLEEDLTTSSPSPQQPITHSRDVRQTRPMNNSTAIRSSQVSASSHIITTPSGGMDTSRSSRLKRTVREESTEEGESLSPSKRYRITSTSPLNKSHGSSPPTLLQGNANFKPILPQGPTSFQPTLSQGNGNFNPTLSQGATNFNWVLPVGTMGANGNTQTVPFVLPMPSASNMQFAVPMGMGHLNSHASPVVLPNGNMTGGAFPAFVIQANGNNTSTGMSPQLANIQPTPVLMAPAPQTLPVLFSSVPNRDIQQMAQERNHLKKENEALKYRLSRFHQLLRNKEKLITILRNLDAVQS